MRRLILSDIHGNAEALEAVLADAGGSYSEVVCCGDLVGYGASPREVAGWARDNAAAIVRGNHDRVCAGLDDDTWFNDAARQAVAWTRAQLSPADLDWLRNLPAGPLEFDGYTLAHGSPDDEDDYLVDEYDVAHLDALLSQPLCFVGHTHLQRGWSWTGPGLDRLSPPEAGAREQVFHLEPGVRYLINPGSVGQPRDHDPRAAYALWDSAAATLALRRVEYDVASAQRRIRNAGLPNWLAERLTTGR